MEYFEKCAIKDTRGKEQWNIRQIRRKLDNKFL
jgi:hypothetical protein